LELQIGIKKIFAERISKCDGILFLIDPEEAWRDHENKVHFGSVLMNAFGELARWRAGKREVFVAFCVTKMDLYPLAWDNVKAFAEEAIFKNQRPILTQLDRFCNPANKVFCRWFPCSSIGFVQDRIAEGMSRHYRDEGGGKIKDSENLRPMGVGEPVAWLLREIGKKKSG
jgi:hypothetical protein